MATGSVTLSPATVTLAARVGTNKCSQKRTKVKYISGLNSFEGLKAHNNVASLGLPLSTEQLFANIVSSLRTTSSSSSQGKGGALSSTCNAAVEIFNISGRFNLERGIEHRLGRDFKEKIKHNGFIDVRNRKGRFKYRVTEESLMDRLTTDTRGSCQSITNNCRVLTVHGSMDEMVPVEDAMEFAKNVSNHKLQIIEGADHEFTLHQDELSSVVVAFVKAGLGGRNYMAMPSESCKRTSGYIHSRF